MLKSNWFQHKEVLFVYSKLNLRPKNCFIEIKACNSVADYINGFHSRYSTFEVFFRNFKGKTKKKRQLDFVPKNLMWLIATKPVFVKEPEITWTFNFSWWGILVLSSKKWQALNRREVQFSKTCFVAISHIRFLGIKSSYLFF